MFLSGWKWYSGKKDGALPSPDVLWVVSVNEKNPDKNNNNNNIDNNNNNNNNKENNNNNWEGIPFD